MKTSTTIQATGLLLLALTLAAAAQGPQGRGPRPGSGQQDGEEGMRPPPAADEIAVLLLDEYDLDGDLALDETELGEAIAALPQPPSPLSESADWVEAYDTDGTGTLSATELAVGLKANKPQKNRRGPPQGNR